MKFGIVVFPGSNCDHDMQYAFDSVLHQETVMLWHKDTDLSAFDVDQDCILLPGGFSYGDYLRAGAIAQFSPIMKPVISFANEGGRVLGICNGFQILCECGLLPGVLLRNAHQKFISNHVFIKKVHDTSLTRLINDEILKVPIAHADGRYYAPKESINKMNENGQILFKYCDQEGNESAYSNPNGSVENIAGVCNTKKNVFGMMPHPERAVDEILGSQDGLKILRSFVNEIPIPQI